MKTWICKVCEYAHHGDEAPVRCPQCGATSAQFYEGKEKRGCSFALLAIAIAVSAIFLSCYSCSSATHIDNSVVNSVEVKRYLGKWYEIARMDHRFERGMTHCTATYTLEEDGTIKITNRGMKNGEWKVSHGVAKLTDSPGLLRISFFRPFYSDYRILLLAPDYSYVLVGGSGNDYLWILSRSPQMDEITAGRIVLEAQRRGYETDNLIWVEQGDKVR